MKTCPKCGLLHNKPGMFCSRSCANSRKFSNITKDLKSKKNKEWWNANKNTDLVKKRISKGILTCIKTRQNKINTLPFEKLSLELQREKILLEQDKKCIECGINQTWNGKTLKFELDHINGDRKNNDRKNLRLLCPNCHSQTETFGNKNKPSVKDEDLLKALYEADSINEALRNVGLQSSGFNYKRAYRLLDKPE